MSQLSRRTLIGSAVLPAFVVPALAGSAVQPTSIAQPGADAELIALGVKLASCSEEWLAQRALDRWEDANGVDADPDLERWGAIHERRWPVTSKIFAFKATTLAGLAVQTHALAIENAEWWDSDNEEHEHARAYIESISSVLGIVPAPVADRIAEEAVQS